MSYWTDREEAARRAYQLEGDAYINAINEIYDSMLDEIQKEINNFYAKYATSEGLTMYEAQKKVSQLDIEEYERKAKKYVETQDFSDQANKEMRLYNLTMKVNRLEMLKSDIGLEMVNSFSQVTKTVQTSLIERATEEYARQAGILGKTVQNNARSAQALVNASFHHANWSDRIWMYQDELKAELDKLLRSGIIQGRSPLDLAQELLKLFNASKYEADRLMRTELARVQIGAEAESLIANGFEYYQFNALGTACPHCLELDEQHFKIADLMPGTNAPPMHPNCMCSISAWMDDELYNEWLESYANHGLSYEDWLAQKEAEPTNEKEILNTDQIIEKTRGFIESGDFNEEDMRATLVGREGFRSTLFSKLGYDAYPTVVSESEFNEAAQGKTILYRGVRDNNSAGLTAAEINEQYRSGTLYTGDDGGAMLGHGTYFGIKESTAEQYATGDKGDILEAVLKDDAKVITFEDALNGNTDALSAVREMVGWDDSKSYDAYYAFLDDAGQFSAIAGYDALYSEDDGIYLILNRGALIVKE